MIDNFREWLSDNLRYVILGLAILVVVIIAICLIRVITGPSSKKDDNGKTTAVTASQNDENESEAAGSAPADVTGLTHNDPAILAIAKKYYTAVGAKDSATLETIVDPWNSTVEQDTFRDNIKSFTNIQTYSKAGPVQGSYLVYVYCDCEVPNVDTPVPSLRQLFVTTSENGEMKISDWNQYADFVTESNQSDEVQALIKQVNEQCQTLAGTDATLKSYLESQGIGQKETESTSAANASGAQNADGGTAIATDGVNVRSEPSTNGTILGTLYTGIEVNVIKVQGDWTQIYYIDGNGRRIEGYCATQYLDFSKNGAAPAASADNSTDAAANTDANAEPAANTV